MNERHKQLADEFGAEAVGVAGLNKELDRVERQSKEKAQALKRRKRELPKAEDAVLQELREAVLAADSNDIDPEVYEALGITPGTTSQRAFGLDVPKAPRNDDVSLDAPSNDMEDDVEESESPLKATQKRKKKGRIPRSA